MKKNQAAPTINQTRPSSEVNWRMLAKARPTATTPATAAKAISTNARIGPITRSRRPASSPPIARTQASARARGWRMKSRIEKHNLPSQRWPWW